MSCALTAAIRRPFARMPIYLTEIAEPALADGNDLAAITPYSAAVIPNPAALFADGGEGPAFRFGFPLRVSTEPDGPHSNPSPDRSDIHGTFTGPDHFSTHQETRLYVSKGVPFECVNSCVWEPTVGSACCNISGFWSPLTMKG
jgi:hypothetical protein